MKIEGILSKQGCSIEFKDGKVYYFSASTQHGVADTLDEAIENIIKADKEFDGMTPISYIVNKMETESEIPDYRQEIEDYIKTNREELKRLLKSRMIDIL